MKDPHPYVTLVAEVEYNPNLPSWEYARDN